ncbi:MAG: hypothetical protein ACOYK1_08600 [Vampirovibrionia bacterium]|jgi:hypothetical protein
MVFNIGGWFNDRVRDFQDWHEKNTIYPRGYDIDQDITINQNTRDIKNNQLKQARKDTSQDLQIQRVQDDIKEFANQLGLDPKDLSAESIRNRVTEITNDVKLTELSDDIKNTVRTSRALDSTQKKVLEDELNALENAWKLKYQENGSKFNLDNANGRNIVSKLLATQNFIQQIEEKNLKTDYVSGIAQTLRDTTNRINSGLRAELPTNERTLVTA